MCVGGRIIEILPTPMCMPDGRRLIRLWIMDDHGDEACVLAGEAEPMPKLGESVWWQGSKIIFADDTLYLFKFGESYPPPGCQFNGVLSKAP